MVARVIAVDPFDLVIFGATGDLATRKLIPAMYFRDLAGQIPNECRIFGTARRPLSEHDFRATAFAAIEEHVKPEDRTDDQVAHFLDRLHYVQVDAAGTKGWTDLREALADEPERIRLFYLATAPDLFGPVCGKLGEYGLATPNSRVIVEKPIGKSLDSPPGGQRRDRGSVSRSSGSIASIIISARRRCRT